MSAGKGDSYRQVNQKKWDENYEKAFGSKKKQTNKPKRKGKKK